MLDNKVLVIDDSTFDLIIASEMLTDSYPNLNVICVNSAIKGLDVLENSAFEDLPDLILLDINMPKMDGFEFLNQYGHLPKPIHKKCSIYMLSSSIDPTDIDLAKRSPFVVDYLEKPLTDEMIKSLIGKINQM